MVLTCQRDDNTDDEPEKVVMTRYSNGDMTELRGFNINFFKFVLDLAYSAVDDEHPSELFPTCVEVNPPETEIGFVQCTKTANSPKISLLAGHVQQICESSPNQRIVEPNLSLSLDCSEPTAYYFAYKWKQKNIQLYDAMCQNCEYGR